MIVRVNRQLFDIVKEKYCSIEYLIEETISMISLTNLKKIPLNSEINDSDIIEIEIPENILKSLEVCVSVKRTINHIVNDVIAIGYILEV